MTDLTDTQKKWILSFKTNRGLTTALNLAVKENKLSFVQLDKIYRYYNNFKEDK